MSNKEKKAKKRKAKDEPAPVIVEFASNDGYSASTGGGELVLPGSKKKAKKEKSQILPEKKENLQKKKRREEVTKALQKQISKKKEKALATVQKRKEKKQTLESLFKDLQQYQLDTSVDGLVSTAHRQDKVKKTGQIEKDPVFPQKIRSVSSIVVDAKVQKIQENYFETDSEDEEEENNPEPVEIKRESTQSSENSVPEVKVSPTKPVPVVEEDPSTKAKKERLNKFFQILSKIKGKNIPVVRDPEIQAKRCKLPIFAEEMQIVEAINENAVVIVCSETGSGKTTQIPQFLYESGYTSNGHLIGITEPRRVAAMSMAERVGKELNDPSKVSFQIRFEGNRTEETKILFMTDGVLLKELQSDLMLSKYSVIIIDEAHERSMYSDVLIGLLSRICFLRAKKELPLKLIIMSATLRLADFTQKRLFPQLTPKVVKVEARQFPVQIHFERRTPEDYLEAAYKKVCNIHEKLPDGAILVFLSGQSEVKNLIKTLTSRYPMKGNVFKGHLSRKRMEKKEKVKLSNYSEEAKKLLNGEKVERNSPDEVKADLEELGTADCAMLDDDDEFEIFSGNLPPPPQGISPLYCLPLYSLLSSVKQQRVFEQPPEGTRLCVIATNVAETSLTIPNIRYVVDSGKEKKRDYDPITGVSKFNVHWISQASAEQRSGRAGRVQAGHAYRLYSSPIYEDFVKFSIPEILNKPVDQLLLNLKSMNIVKVANFPFPTPPDSDQLEAAEKRLILLGALTTDGKKDAKVTTLGKTLSLFPLAPAFSKMLAMANQHGLMPYAIYLVSALSIREPMIHVARSISENNSIEAQKKMKEVLKQRQNWCGSGQSRRLGDLSVLLKALGAADFGQMSPRECENLGLRYKAVVEIRKMRRQLINLINTSCNLKKEITLDNKLEPPSEEQCRMLRQILIACLPNQIAKRIDESPGGKNEQGGYQCQLLEEVVFIDSSSMLFKDLPEYVLYQEIVQFGTRKCLQNVTMVEPEWLSQLTEPYCEFKSFDVEKEAPFFDEASGKVVQKTEVFFGERKWKLPLVNRELSIDINHYKYFAKFFLEGKIFKKLEKNVSLMLAPPETMIKPWAKLQKKTDKILNALIEKEVLSRSGLLEAWEKTEDYLLEEYLEWLPVSVHDKTRIEWPPI
ncbi:hypothetical protein FO519_005218 [Halicephalobus sp. NKZ332]|nr:hypothetical protein FO519_005218 [Halicephalobus sp. NKZ332]